MIDKYGVREFHVEGTWTESEVNINYIVYYQTDQLDWRIENLTRGNLEWAIFGWPQVGEEGQGLYLRTKYCC